jgi:DNA-binding XRE family transcriptional regulator
MVAFMACCREQVEANGDIYDRRNRAAFRPEARMTPAQVAAALGVTATPYPAWEDPEALRQGRVALGLEQRG